VLEWTNKSGKQRVLPLITVQSIRSIHQQLIQVASRLDPWFSTGVPNSLGRRVLLPFLIIALASSQGGALAQGTLTNGANHAGVILVGGSDTWTLQATANDSITVSIGELLGSGADPIFSPWIRQSVDSAARPGRLIVGFCFRP
jgi:hypothetical protein